MMSENLILNWVHSLAPPDRQHLADRLRMYPSATASTLLMAWADAGGLRVSEVSALLPGILVQARQAANALAADGVGRTVLADSA